ncbi:hypothetical protein EON83_12500 [bacterium]|nr:MAG: hypothetical protein EON83_12500 [bacterium]
MKKFLSIAFAGISLACCALLSVLPTPTATASPPGFDFKAYDFKHEYQHELKEKRPWLNPARAAILSR